MKGGKRKGGGRKVGAYVAATIGVAVLSTASRGAEKTVQWLGRDGSWDDSGSWSGGVVPQNNAVDQYVALIDGGRALGTAVTAGTVTVNAVTVDALDRLDISPNRTFTAVRGLEVNGYAALPSGAQIRVGDNGALTGSGAIEGFYGNNYLTATGGSLTIGTGLRVGNGDWAESGFMEIGGDYPLINNGTIAALRSSVLVHGTTVTNNGAFRVANGGRVDVGGTIDELADLGTVVNDDGTGVLRFVGTVDNRNSTFVVDRTIVGLEVGGTITGGAVTATGGRRLNTSAQDLLLDNVTLNAPVTVNGVLRVEAGQALAGNADVLLKGTVRSRSGALAIGPGINLHGAGTVGTVQDALAIAGAVRADQFMARLTVQGNGITNTGTLEVSNGAVLAVGGTFTMDGLGTVVNNGGTLEIVGTVQNAGRMFVNGSPNAWQLGTNGTITGGTIETLPGRNLTVVGTAVLDGVTLNGTVQLAPATGGSVQLNVSNGVTGTGTILLGGSSASTVRNFVANVVRPVELGAGVTIRGGSGRVYDVINHGTIEAESGATVDLALSQQPSTGGRVLSDGTLRIALGGKITSQALALGSGGRLAVELGGSATQQAVLAVTGNLDLAGEDSLDLIPASAEGTAPFLVATYTGTLTGTFDHVTPGYAVDYSTPHQIFATVPEPATLASLAAGLTGLSLLRRARRRRSSPVPTA
jgi:hypothetical protein